MSWLTRLKNGLSKTRENTIGKIAAIITKSGNLDEDTLSEIEEALLLADIGVSITMDLIDNLREQAKINKKNDPQFVLQYLRSEIERLISSDQQLEVDHRNKPWVILIVGVNGVGKTTTVGKMAHYFAAQSKKVLLVAGDTFRAAASEQLEIWAKRADVGIVRHQDGSDPASVVFDAMDAAKARDIDIMLIDTAGRLHTKINLMEELKKIKRVLQKHDATCPHETLLVLDATTGQNALQQAKSFHDLVTCTGVVVTKLDGTAKGGIILGIKKELGIPVRMIGVGEGIEDLKPFNPTEYAEALFDFGENVEIDNL